IRSSWAPSRHFSIMSLDPAVTFNRKFSSSLSNSGAAGRDRATRRRRACKSTCSVPIDVDHVRAAAYRAVLDVLLARPRRQVDGHEDVLPAGIALVAGLVLHHRQPPTRFTR